MMNSWDEFIADEMSKDYFKVLDTFLKEEAKTHTIFPPKKLVFNAFELCPLDKVRICILGQDPYMNPNQAMGLCFSVPKSVAVPPSLRNIYKELHNDLGIVPPEHGDLTAWARQNVFLLNSVLTVRQGQAGSHAKRGWEIFTDNAIRLLNDQDRSIVYLLWGNYARSKKELITNPKHLILESSHPSPFSCQSFFGGRHFSKANDFLVKNNIEPIDWSIK